MMVRTSGAFTDDQGVPDGYPGSRAVDMTPSTLNAVDIHISCRQASERSIFSVAASGKRLTNQA